MRESGRFGGGSLGAQANRAPFEPQAGGKEIRDGIRDGHSGKRHGRITGGRCDSCEGDGHEKDHHLDGEPAG